MVVCKKCSRELPAGTEVCPECAAPVRRKIGWFGILLIVAFALLVLAVIGKALV